MQLAFEFKDYNVIPDFPIDRLTISPMNLRAGIDDIEHIKVIANSINEKGYQPNRGLLVNSNNGDCRVVAGSNRLKAMRYLGRTTVPVYLFTGLTDEQEARLSEEDNRLDETHKPTHFLDVAEAYLRLSKAEYSNVWIAEQYYESRKREDRVRQMLKIALLPHLAKDIIRGKKSERVLKILRVKDKKSFTSDSENFPNYFKEGHFQEIIQLRRGGQIKIVAQIALSKGNIKGQKLKDECNNLKHQEKLKQLVLDNLYEKKLSILREVFGDIERDIYGDGKGENIAFEDSALGKRIASLNEKAQCRFVCDDATNPEVWQEVKDKSIAAVIADPPYGIDYLTNYRIIDDDIVQPIKNDDDVGKATSVFAKTLENLNPKMQDDSHLYVFSSWKVYPEFAEMIKKYFVIKNVIVWDKGNWTAGDLEGNYGEQYEIIIFATKGNRKLCGEKRLTNLMSFPRVAGNEQIVSTQKPVDLVKTLLMQSVSKGELVCDPFAGSGTLAVACHEQNPYFCLEIDEVTYKKAVRRIDECLVFSTKSQSGGTFGGGVEKTKKC